MVTVALMAVVLKLSGSSTAVGGILVLRLVPAAVAGPLAARAAHYWDRRRTMLAADIVRAGIVVALPFIQALWFVYTCAFLLEVGGLVFLPARDASIPDLVGEEDDLPVANALILASSYGTIPLGAAAFAAVSAASPHSGFIGSHPLSLVFWVDAATFLVSFWMISRLVELGPGGEAPTSAEPSFRRAFRIPLVRAVLPATVAVGLGIGALFSLGVVYVRDVLGASDTAFGVLIALFGVGAGGGLAALQAWPHDDYLTHVRRGVAVQGAVVAFMSAANSVGLAYLGAVLFGAATAFALAAGMSQLQTALEGEDRVLAFTGFHLVIRATLSFAAITAGVASDLVGKVHVFLIGRVPPVRFVLVCSGLVAVAGSRLVRLDRSPH